jgi:hypothetical protein
LEPVSSRSRFIRQFATTADTSRVSSFRSRTERIRSNSLPFEFDGPRNQVSFVVILPREGIVSLSGWRDVG